MSRHRYECRVRFSDVDVYGHVNNVKYLEYYQEARLAFWAGQDMRLAEEGIGLVIARIDVDYRRPVLFRPEPYVIESWVTRVGRSSFDLAAEISDGEHVLSRAQSVLVAFDGASQSSRALSEQEHALLGTYQG